MTPTILPVTCALAVLAAVGCGKPAPPAPKRGGAVRKPRPATPRH